MMRSYEGDNPYVFVSYAHANADKISPIIEQLGEDSFRLWYDEGIYSGDEWREVVASHLLGSKCVLAFISKEFCLSKNCKDEINLAHEHCTIIPVYIDAGSTPEYLSAGMRLSLSGYNAIYGFKYFADGTVKSLVKKYVILRT